MKQIFGFMIVFAIAALLISQPAGRQQVGPLPDGGFLLNSGWMLHPAGKQIPLDTLPMSTALTPDGKYLLVLNEGYRPPSISVLDVAAEREVNRIAVADGFLGLTITRDGRTVYVGGGSRSRVFEFTLAADGKLSRGREFVITPDSERTYRDFTGDVTLSPDGHLIYATDLFHDSVVVINPQSGRVIERWKRGAALIESCSIRMASRFLFRAGPMAVFLNMTQTTDLL